MTQERKRRRRWRRNTKEYKGIQRKAKQQQTFWSFQGCLVTTANYLQGRETGQYRRRLLLTHHSLQLSLAWKIVWKSTVQYGKTGMEFSQERMKGNFAIHPTMVNSTCLSEKEKRHKNYDMNRRTC